MRSPLLGGNADPAAAACMQALLMNGQKAEALKCEPLSSLSATLASACCTSLFRMC